MIQAYFTGFLLGTIALVVASAFLEGRKWEENHCVEINYQPPMDRYTSMGDRITLPAQTTLKCDDGREIVR